MDEYIEREMLMKFPIRYDNYDEEHGSIEFINGIETVLEYANSIPAADVAPVVRGYWVRIGTNHFECTNCEYDYYDTLAEPISYCPNCGAKMNGGEEDAAG